MVALIDIQPKSHDGSELRTALVCVGFDRLFALFRSKHLKFIIVFVPIEDCHVIIIKINI